MDSWVIIVLTTCTKVTWASKFFLSFNVHVHWRERVKLYLEKYREKLHSINPSSALLDQIQVLMSLINHLQLERNNFFPHVLLHVYIYTYNTIVRLWCDLGVGVTWSRISFITQPVLQTLKLKYFRWSSDYPNQSYMFLKFWKLVHVPKSIDWQFNSCTH